MKKAITLWTALMVAMAYNAIAQPQQQTIESKADRSTVEYAVRDGKPILMDIYQLKD